MRIFLVLLCSLKAYSFPSIEDCKTILSDKEHEHYAYCMELAESPHIEELEPPKWYPKLEVPKLKRPELPRPKTPAPKLAVPDIEPKETKKD